MKKTRNLPKTGVGMGQMGLSTTKPLSLPCCQLEGHTRSRPWNEITRDCKLRADIS